MSERPLVLLSNDDGYAADGLRALAAALREHVDLVVCAPEQNQSAASHALSLHRALRLRAVEPGVFAIDGTPADCVYVALHSGDRLLPRRPDLVVSGMNQGVNLGLDVFYSGTVAAAREGAIRGVPSIAVSADMAASFSHAARVGADLALRLLEQVRGGDLPRAPLLNVNIPAGDAWPIEATRLGSRVYANSVIYREDPRGAPYLWIGGERAHHEPSPGSDTDAFDGGRVSVTQLSLDLASADPASLATRLVGTR